MSIKTHNLVFSKVLERKIKELETQERKPSCSTGLFFIIYRSKWLYYDQLRRCLAQHKMREEQEE